MELDNSMMNERRIVKLLEDSALSDTVCDDGEQESRYGEPQNAAGSTPGNNRPASSTPQSVGHPGHAHQFSSTGISLADIT